MKTLSPEAARDADYEKRLKQSIIRMAVQIGSLKERIRASEEQLDSVEIDIEDAIRRLKEFEKSGVLLAPGVYPSSGLKKKE